MPTTLYSFKLKCEVPLLSDDEYRPIAHALAQRMAAIRSYRLQHNVTLEEARRCANSDALDYYERLTGIRLAHPEELYAVRLSDYGRPCPQCGKPFRTPKAKLCAECGFALPPGEVAGAATLSDA
jgi:hypothetical protein